DSPPFPGHHHHRQTKRFSRCTGEGFHRPSPPFACSGATFARRTGPLLLANDVAVDKTRKRSGPMSTTTTPTLKATLLSPGTLFASLSTSSTTTSTTMPSYRTQR